MLKNSKIATALILILYVVSWIFWGSETAIKSNLALLLEQDIRQGQGIEFTDYRSNESDSTIYVLNSNNFGFYSV